MGVSKWLSKWFIELCGDFVQFWGGMNWMVWWGCGGNVKGFGGMNFICGVRVEHIPRNRQRAD